MRQPPESMKNTQVINGSDDLYTLMTVITHLTTCYAFRPCKPIADNIIRHLQHLLNSPSKALLGEWADNFNTLLKQWQIIAEHHDKVAGTEKTATVPNKVILNG